MASPAPLPIPQAISTTGPENPLREYSESEKEQLNQAAKKSETTYKAWKEAQQRGEQEGSGEGGSKDELDELRDQAEQAQEDEKQLQDLCD